MSRAGHDAQEIAAIAPTAMIFVRGQDDGISHNPREHSTPEDCALAISVQRPLWSGWPTRPDPTRRAEDSYRDD